MIPSSRSRRGGHFGRELFCQVFRNGEIIGYAVSVRRVGVKSNLYFVTRGTLELTAIRTPECSLDDEDFNLWRLFRADNC
jgi:hypothetical protein